jgi:hypothetical protein
VAATYFLAVSIRRSSLGQIGDLRLGKDLQRASTAATVASSAARQDWTRAPSLGGSRTRDGGQGFQPRFDMGHGL